MSRLLCTIQQQKQHYHLNHNYYCWVELSFTRKKSFFRLFDIYSYAKLYNSIQQVESEVNESTSLLFIWHTARGIHSQNHNSSFEWKVSWQKTLYQDSRKVFHSFASTHSPEEFHISTQCRESCIQQHEQVEWEFGVVDLSEKLPMLVLEESHPRQMMEKFNQSFLCWIAHLEAQQFELEMA